MTDLIVDSRYVGRDQLTDDEKRKEDDAIDVTLVRLRYRLLATREVNLMKREKLEALTEGTKARLERSLQELRGS